MHGDDAPLYISFVSNKNVIDKTYWPLAVVISMEEKHVTNYANISISYKLYVQNTLGLRDDWFIFHFEQGTGRIVGIEVTDGKKINDHPPGFTNIYKIKDVLDGMQIIQFSSEMKWKPLKSS